IVQSIGQAMYEEVVYDEQGQLLTGTLMDYAVPRASHVPEFELDRTETPSPVNPLGVKGVGEAGTIGATPAIVNAIVDALAPFGVTHIDMPVKPETVWRIIKGYKELCTKSPYILISLCNLCVLYVSVVCFCSEFINHRDTENTEIAQRRG